MQERIEELVKKAGIKLSAAQFSGVLEAEVSEFDLNDFAESIAEDCIVQCREAQQQTVSNASDDYEEGRKMGIEVSVNYIKRHFGVE